MRTLILFIAAFSFSLVTRAQAPSSLLWRIKHPNSKANSYLYGTMHLQDKRLFYFTDSLYASLKSVEGFAGELDMNNVNEIVSSWIKQTGSSDEAVRFLRDYISPAQRKKYKQALEKKFGKKLYAITLQELEAETTNWSMGFRKEDDMPTFVDAFLYGIAKREGKWVGALEKIDEQLNADPAGLEEQIKSALLTEKDRKKMIDRFVDIYLSGNLYQMQEIVNNAGGNYGAWQLNRRNLTMVQRMDSLTAVRSCFYAVGAAHLSGDSGMLQLLRNRGYQVEPVVSATKIPPDTYLAHPTAYNWQLIQWGDGDFSIRMPGSATSLDGMGGFHQARMYFDPLSMSGFMSGYIPLANKSAAEIDSVCRLMPSYYATEGKLFRDSSWLLNGKKAYEIEASTKDGFVTMAVHPVAGGIVMNMIFSMSKAGLKMHNAAVFFTSFIDKKKPLPPPVKGWRRKIYARQQFSFEAPIELDYSSPNSDSSWYNQTYSGTDPQSRIFYSITAMETKKGYYSRLDSLYFQDLVDQYTTSNTHKLLQHSFTSLDGFPGISMLLGTKVEKDSVYVRFNVVNRGNRRYSMVVGYYPTREQEEQADRFIKSVRFLPYVASKVVDGHPAYENFSIQSPGIFTVDQSAVLSEGLSRFILYDTTTAVTLQIQKEPLNKFYRTANDSSFFREQLNDFIVDTDSILPYTIHEEQGQRSVEVTVKMEGTHNIRRIKLLASGDTLYSLSGIMSPEISQAAAYQKTYSSFKLLSPNKNQYTRSKAKLVFNELLLPDSLAFEEAKAALEWVYIDAADLPMLQEALLHPMIDFSQRASCAHDELIKRVLEFNNAPTISFIQKVYAGLRERNAELQYPLLSILARMYTRESYEVLEGLLKSGLPVAGNAGILYGSMKDSLELAGTIIPFILDNKNDSLLKKILPALVYDLKQRNELSDEAWRNVQPALFYLADEYNQEQKAENVELPLYFDGLLDLLISYDDAGSRQRLDSFALHKNLDVQYSTFIALLLRKKPAPAQTIQRLAADLYYRSRVWEELEDAGFAKSFPTILRNQKSIATSHLFRKIWNESGEADLQFIKEQTRRIAGKKQKLYLFKVSFKTEDGQEEYLGVAGPYPLKGKLQATPGAFNGVYYAKIFDAAAINELLEAFIQSLQ